MNKLLPNILLALILFCCACEEIDDINGGNGNGKGPGSIGTAGTDRTVLVYIAANGNLASYARNDLQEMAVGMQDADDTRYNLLVYSDTGSNPALFRFGKDSEGVVLKDTIASYPSQDSLDPEIMKSIFTEAFKACPADKYGLVVWSHAEGWLESPVSRAIGPSGGKYMDIAEFKEILEDSPYFEYIYFEACFMSGIEVMYELRNHTDYFIGSPTETPGTGAPYDLIMEALLTNQPVEAGEIYYEHYAEIYTGNTPTNSLWTGGGAIAVVKTDALDDLAKVTREFMMNYLPEGEISKNGIYCYDKRRTQYYYDMDDFMKSIITNEEDYQEWKACYDKAIAYYNTTDKNYSSTVGMFSMVGTTGISTYIPSASQAALFDFYKTYDWYEAGGWNTWQGWQSW